MLLFDDRLDLIVVDAPGLRVDAVGNDVVGLAGVVDRRAVAQMAAVFEAHADERVARLQKRGVDGQIRLRAAVRLDVDGLAAEERLGALDRDALDLVDDLAAAVITLAGQTLGVFVGQNAPHAGDDGRGGDVLRGDQLEVALLAAQLLRGQLGDLGVRFADEVDGRQQLAHFGILTNDKKYGHLGRRYPRKLRSPNGSGRMISVLLPERFGRRLAPSALNE